MTAAAVFDVGCGDFFCYLEKGNGLPFGFQHGLGGSWEQAVELFDELQEVRLFAMDCRNHGNTKTINDVDLTADILLEDQLRFAKSVVKTSHVVGGLSLGSLLAIKTALAIPDMILGLVLLRPAWPDASCSTNFTSLKSVIDTKFHGLLSADNELPLADLSRINAPALVMGMPNDSRHPIEFAELVSETLPNSVFYEVPDKGRHISAYRDSIRQHTSDFLASI